jgi:hypothetical protein
MPAPASLTYALTAIVAAHQGLLTRIETGAGDPSLAILDADDTLLAEVDLTAGAVASGTGQITFTHGAAVGAASGVAAYGEIRDGGGVAQISMPAQAGSVAVSGKLVINTLTIIAGQPVNLVSLTVG